MRRHLATVAVLGLALAGARPAHAGVTHVVAHGESLSGVAADAYGSAWKWVYIAEANKVSGQRVHPGRRLKIPTARPYVVRHGDSLAGIAQHYLGSSDRFAFLAKMNGLQDPRSLSPGSRILIPAVLRHQLLRGESLGGLARRFYRTRRAAKLLRTYNGLAASRVSPGTVLYIPLLDPATDATEVRRNFAAGGAAARKAAAAKAAREKRQAAARAAKAAAAKAAAARHQREAAARAAKAAAERAAREKAAAARAATKKAAREKAAREKREAAAKAAAQKAARQEAARNRHKAAAKAPDHAAPTVAAAPSRADPVVAAAALYRRGDYKRTVTALEGFLAHGTQPAPATEARARRLLGFALVALGRRGEALEQFQRLLALEPKAALDPVRTSPKILKVFEQAKRGGG